MNPRIDGRALHQGHACDRDRRLRPGQPRQRSRRRFGRARHARGRRHRRGPGRWSTRRGAGRARATAPSTTRWAASSGSGCSTRSAARIDGRPAVPRHLPRLSAPLHRERGVRAGQGPRRHARSGAPLSPRAQGAAHGLEPALARRRRCRSSTGIPDGRVLLLRAFVLPRGLGRARDGRRAHGAVRVRPPLPRRGGARSALRAPSSIRRRARAGGSGSWRTSPGSWLSPEAARA